MQCALYLNANITNAKRLLMETRKMADIHFPFCYNENYWSSLLTSLNIGFQDNFNEIFSCFLSVRIKIIVLRTVDFPVIETRGRNSLV